MKWLEEELSEIGLKLQHQVWMGVAHTHAVNRATWQMFEVCTFCVFLCGWVAFSVLTSCFLQLCMSKCEICLVLSMLPNVICCTGTNPIF